MSNCLFVIEGGMGKTVMATQMCKQLKESGKYDKVFVCTSYTDIMDCCSYVDTAFPLSPLSNGVYEDIIKDESTKIFWVEPYSHPDFIRKKIHLFDAWADLLDLPRSNNPMSLTPVLDRIEQAYPNCGVQAKAFITRHPNFSIIQISGGQSPLSPVRDYREAGLKRNYPMNKAEELVHLYKEQFPDTEMFQFRLDSEPAIQGTSYEVYPYLTWALIAKKAKHIFCIDSSLQHLCASQGVCCNVIWAETKPEHFGYNLHRNYVPYVRDSQPYFKPLGSSPAIINYTQPQEVMNDE